MRATAPLGCAIVGGLAVLLVSACSYRARPVSGQQQCGPVAGKRCPDGYHCAVDDRCWKNGEGPDGGGPVPEGGAPDVPPPAETEAGGSEAGGIDMAPTVPPDATAPRDATVLRDIVEPDLPPPVPAPSSRALAAGATISESATYRAIRILGQAPGGNAIRSSATYRAVGGLVGATQR